MTRLRLESLVRLSRGLTAVEGQSGKPKAISFDWRSRASQLARDGYTMRVRPSFVHIGTLGLEQASNVTARHSSLLVSE